MIKKQKLILIILVIAVTIAMLSALVACDYIAYEPEPGKKPPAASENIPLPAEYTLFVQAYGGRPVGTKIGAAVPESYKFTVGASIGNALNYIKDGYDFAGWHLDTEFTKPLKSFIMPDSDLSVYAKWNKTPEPVTPPEKEPETVTITFEVGTQSGIDPSAAAVAPLSGKAGSLIMDENITAMPSPTYHGYKFIGWFYDKAHKNPFVLTDSTVFPESNTVLYARWEKEFFTVNFDSKGGSSVESQKLTTGSQVVNPGTPIRAGYNFLGWFLDGDVEADFTALFVVDKNIEIFAKWEAKLYTLTFDEESAGAAIEPISAVTDADLTGMKPADPTKTGYNFLGWYENKKISTGDLPFDFSAMVPRDTTLYAQWTPKDHVLTLTLGQGDVVGNLYPTGDPAEQEVYAILKLKAEATTDHTVFASLSFITGITELKVTLSDGTVEVYSNAHDIAKLITMTQDKKTVDADAETDVKLSFKLDKDADIKYASAKFEFNIKLYTIGIVDGDGNDVNADEIKTTVKL